MRGVRLIILLLAIAGMTTTRGEAAVFSQISGVNDPGEGATVRVDLGPETITGYSLRFQMPDTLRLLGVQDDVTTTSPQTGFSVFFGDGTQPDPTPPADYSELTPVAQGIGVVGTQGPTGNPTPDVFLDGFRGGALPIDAFDLFFLTFEPGRHEVTVAGFFEILQQDSSVAFTSVDSSFDVVVSDPSAGTVIPLPAPGLLLIGGLGMLAAWRRMARG